MQFSKASTDKLATCDYRLRSIMFRAIQVSDIDFGIAEGNRSIERQKELFAIGKSKIDGINQLSKHNHSPSLAVDIYGYVNGKMDYSVPVMCYLAGIIMTCASELGYTLRWGGNWDRDGEILTDQSFDDLPHFEIE